MKNTNEPAFPYPKQILGSGEDYHEIPGAIGLTKREYFAAMAMQGMIASGRYTGLTDSAALEYTAIDARNYADALLTELEKPQL